MGVAVAAAAGIAVAVAARARVRSVVSMLMESKFVSKINVWLMVLKVDA